MVSASSPAEKSLEFCLIFSGSKPRNSAPYQRIPVFAGALFPYHSPQSQKEKQQKKKRPVQAADLMTAIAYKVVIFDVCLIVV